jgi:hypothetical protein
VVATGIMAASKHLQTLPAKLGSNSDEQPL